MFRRAFGVVLIGLMSVVPLAAEGQTSPSRSSSTSHSTAWRTTWTIVGAAAGFTAGALIGLNKFDDAINSDRKVWTSALVGAAAGGVAGAVLSRNRGPVVPVGGKPGVGTRSPIDVSWASALDRTTRVDPPRSGGLALGTEHAHDR